MISAEDKQALLHIARAAIIAKVNDEALPSLDERGTVESRLHEPGGAFVTLKKRNRLRGCIGLLESELPLQETIQYMAIAAATEDSRFPAVQSEEVDDLRIEISVLSPLCRIMDIRKIRLGVDGVLIRQGRQSGVFLPQVAQDTGWTLEQFLSELCANKAGLAPDAWQDEKTEMYAFTVEVIEETN